MPIGAGGSAAEHYSTVTIHVDLVAIGTSAVGVYSGGAFGFRYRLVQGKAGAMVAGTGAGATRALNIIRFRNGVGTVIGTFTATLANTAFPSIVPVTLSGGDYDFEDADELRISSNAGGTVFTAGQLNLILTIASRGQRRN